MKKTLGLALLTLALASFVACKQAPAPTAAPDANAPAVTATPAPDANAPAVPAPAPEPEKK